MIRVVQGDMAQAGTEAVLRPVSAEWGAVTPSMRRLELIAGPEVEAQCRRIGDLPVGSAVITTAGALHAQFMVHAIVRSIDEQVTESIVRRALQNGLRRLVEWGIASVAIPPIGTGAGNLDPEDAAREMIPTIIEHMRSSLHPSRVELFVESDYERDAFERVLRTYELPILSDEAAAGPVFYVASPPASDDTR